MNVILKENFSPRIYETVSRVIFQLKHATELKDLGFASGDTLQIVFNKNLYLTFSWKDNKACDFVLVIEENEFFITNDELDEFCIHPAEVLKQEFIIPLRYKYGDIAKILNVSKSTITDILLKKRGISDDIAFRIAHCMGTTPTFWLNMQLAWDQKSRQKKFDERAKELTKTLSKLPVLPDNPFRFSYVA